MRKHITKSLQLLFVVLITGLTATYTAANSTIPKDDLSPCETVGEWKQISEVDGISISYSSIACDDETYLAIKFENSTETKLNFIWSLTDDSQNVIISEDEMHEEMLQLAANEVHIFKGAYLVKLTDDADFSNFKVTIQALKN